MNQFLRVGFYFAFCSVFIFLILPGKPVAAQTGSIVSDISVNYAFGEEIIVQGKINPGFDYQSLAVHFSLADQGDTLVIALQPADTGDFSVTHRISDQFVAPFSTISYRFVLTDWDEKVIVSENYSFVYEDNRFEWQHLTEDQVTVNWYAGDTEFAQKILDSAGFSIDRGAALLKTGTIPVIELYIYENLADYRTASGESGPAWAGGHTNPTAGIVLVAITPGLEAQVEIDRKIPHEIAHVLLREAAGEGSANLPAWLDEGFASNLETFPNPDYEYLVRSALADDFIALESLCEVFPQDSTAALLAYAESSLFVRYLEETYGPAAIRSLVASYSSGVSCRLGTSMPPIGIDLESVQAAWIEHLQSITLQPVSSPTAAFEEYLPWLMVFLVVFTGPIIVLIGSALSKGKQDE